MPIMQLFVFQNFNWTVTVVDVIFQQAGISPGIGMGIPVIVTCDRS